MRRLLFCTPPSSFIWTHVRGFPICRCTISRCARCMRQATLKGTTRAPLLCRPQLAANGMGGAFRDGRQTNCRRPFRLRFFYRKKSSSFASTPAWRALLVVIINVHALNVAVTVALAHVSFRRDWHAHLRIGRGRCASVACARARSSSVLVTSLAATSASS